MPAAPIPDRLSLRSLREAAAGCEACALHRCASRVVFGEGLKRSTTMLVGETPGDREDLAGHVFVGPAGHLLDRALRTAGLDRSELYLTNAVKHFRFRRRGKRRIHQTPTAEHVNACRPWLEAEITVVRPRVLVLMGAVAAHSLLGSQVRVTVDRGRLMESHIAERVFVTVHPSSILRIEGSRDRRTAFDAFVSDLRVAVGDA